jgi:DNA-binding protein YbaB
VSGSERDRSGEESGDRMARMLAITEDLAGEEFEAAARSGHAMAVVDGRGTLVDLRVADEALTVRGLDLDALNADLLEAITGARRQAAERACQLLNPVFPALFPEMER